MPCRYQPERLADLSEDRVVSGLVGACQRAHELTRRAGAAGAQHTRQQTCALLRDRVRPRWTASVVPTPVRRRLLAKCMDVLAAAIRDGHSVGAVADDVPLYLLTVMLDADVRRLRVQLCCYYGCGHQTALLKLLAAEARGLASLELVRPTLLRLDTQLFQSVLLSMNNLKRLVLKNIASDKILKTIGHSCTQLETLDISHSSQVTDDGIKHLLLQIEIKDKSNGRIATGNIRSTNRTSWWHNMKSLSKRLKLKTGGRRKTDDDDLSFLLEYRQKPTRLCSTLCTLNIANTSVTSRGILMALQNIPNLETLGEYCHIGKALELLDKCAVPSAKLKLTMANACRTTSARLQVLCNTCTVLNRLTIIEPLHSPVMLGGLPDSLTIINLQNVPGDRAWLDGLYGFLSRPQSRALRELFLKFRRDDGGGGVGVAPPAVDLGVFLPRLADLETLSIDGADATLRQPAADATTLRRLRKIQLSRVDGPDAVLRLLACAPALGALHVYACTGLDGPGLVDVLLRARSAARPPSGRLNCLYVNELPDGGVDTVKCVVDAFPEIHKIGNVGNWGGIGADEIRGLNAWKRDNNFKLELHANAHWFCSECFPVP